MIRTVTTKLIVPQLIKKLMLWNTAGSSPVHALHACSMLIPSHLCLGLQSSQFPSGTQTKPRYPFLLPHMWITIHSHPGKLFCINPLPANVENTVSSE